MPLEQSEVEKIIQLYLQKLVPNNSCHKARAEELAKELEVVVRPVIDRLKEKLRWMEQEKFDVVEELESEQGTSADLRQELEEIETEKQYAELIKIFEECC